MNKNVGVTDRIIRFVFMDLLLGMCLWGMNVPLWFANFSFVFSIYLVFTMITGYSPIYMLLKFSTLEEKTES
ncbi:MAG: YgaP family membrane protein [Saprospiraceae bacterium]